MLTPGPLPVRVFLVVAAVAGLALVAGTADRRPLNVHTGYAPEQPIPYSHRLHAGELSIDCLYCHFGARTSRHAGIPPTGLCMNCHAQVTSSLDALLAERGIAEAEDREPERVVSAPIQALYDALALDADGQPTGAEPRSIPWVRVHALPDFVAFDHSVHVARGVACQSCHGPVQSMERVRQETDLGMGWCVDCHRRSPRDPAALAPPGGARLDPPHHVTTDCVACHY